MMLLPLSALCQGDGKVRDKGKSTSHTNPVGYLEILIIVCPENYILDLRFFQVICVLEDEEI